MKLHVIAKIKGTSTVFDKLADFYVELVFLKDKKLPALRKRLMEEYPGIFSNMEILNVKFLKPAGKVKFK